MYSQIVWCGYRTPSTPVHHQSSYDSQRLTSAQSSGDFDPVARGVNQSLEISNIPMKNQKYRTSKSEIPLKNEKSRTL